jgi:glycogen synthase
MKILMTTDCVGGVWTFTLELARSLATRDVEITLACLGGRLSAADRDEAGKLSKVVLREAPYRLEWMESPWDDVASTSQWLRELIAESGADLLHLNCYGPGMYDYDVPVLLTAHSCVNTWWQAVHGHAPDDGWKRYRDCVLSALARADRVVAPTSAFRAALGAAYAEVEMTPISVVHNGIDVVPDDLNAGGRAPFVLSAGRIWDEAKQLRRLVEAAPRLMCPVFIAGAGRFERPAPGVVSLGRVSRAQLAAYYRRASVYAHPAVYEPFGLSILEAAAAGCPLVLADIPTLRELWSDAAVFVAREDTGAWGRTLNELLGNAPARRTYGRAARERALRYSARKMAEKYLAHYQQLSCAEAAA